jgi:hypothetical protein
MPERDAEVLALRAQLDEAVRLLRIDHGGVQPGCDVCAFLATREETE